MESREMRSLNLPRAIATFSVVRKCPLKLIFPSILVLVAVIGGWIWRSCQPQSIAPLASIFPLSAPVDGALDFRFQFLSVWHAAEIPLALRFDPPLGTENGGLVYNAQKFWDMNTARGGHHTGDDLNGIGGMNSDLGDPVFAVADGLVIYTGEPSPGWGKLIILAHTTLAGLPLQSMFAHMQEIDVQRGTLVARGQKIGRVGTANGNYPAHLHFEMRASDGIDLGAGYTMQPLNRLDPSATIDSLRNAASDEISPSPLIQALKNSAATN
jgi:Peptidase family M23